jgi:hypothetical protein
MSKILVLSSLLLAYMSYFSHHFWVAIISLLKLACIIDLDGIEGWNQEFQQDLEKEH